MPMFTHGLDQLALIESADFRWMLTRAPVSNLDAGLLFDLDPATIEVSVAGYARVALSGGARSINMGTNTLTYTADNPTFGSLTAGQTVTGALLYLHVTNDDDSVPIYYSQLAPRDTDDLNPFTFELPDGVIATLSEVS